MPSLGAVQILFYPEEYQRLYNCSAYDVESIPLERRQHRILGTSYIVLFLVYEVIQLVHFTGRTPKVTTFTNGFLLRHVT